jgi:hypothetical protein
MEQKLLNDIWEAIILELEDDSEDAIEELLALFTN